MLFGDSRAAAFARALLFFWIGNAIIWATNPWVSLWFHLDPLGVAIGEGQLLLALLIPLLVFAYFEGRRIDAYGLPLSQAFRKLFWEGALIGAAEPAIIGIAMLVGGGFVIHGLNAQGHNAAWNGLAWFGACFVVGIAEEYWYRGYMLQTLGKAIGFWPAATVLALLFTSDHFFFKPGENLLDAAMLFGYALFACLTVRLTGNLWFAVGEHTLFDFVQFFFIGGRNGSTYPAGRLFDATFPGPVWLNGGPNGTESSVFVYPVLALVFVYVLVRFRKPRQTAAIAAGASI